MTLTLIDMLYNGVAFLFWIRIWTANTQAALFNPYLQGIQVFTQPLLDVTPPSFRIRAVDWGAVLAWGLMVIFRGVALPVLNPTGIQNAWQLLLGFDSLVPAQSSAQGLMMGLIFSLMSFGIFLFYVWGLALLFMRRFQMGQVADRTLDFVCAVARPFSILKPFVRPWILLVFGVTLVSILSGLRAEDAASLGSSTGLIPGLRATISVLAGFAELLMILQSLLIILIIGSWVSLFTGGGVLDIFCREWMDFVLGPFRRFPLQIGFFDLTPIIVFILLELAHFFVKKALWVAYVVCR